ncbi:uncharacterized protein TM35_000361050 [Trypanosoma theileri]|uniref:CCHC-type domain-containing protein n=1 Tax=Trypanosoma theileri TaxID=67003 RepID=A0A1X0NKI7_9TRYP|nr:uncharacterized protein TM35_000361050 [Trypanosoma theileri]ORC85245.1 hypothetical protein TM35_000361050 [Trypanosoma theileri]
MEEPQPKEDSFLQAAAKLKRKHSAPPPSKRRCFRCGRIGHYSTTCRVNTNSGLGSTAKNLQERSKHSGQTRGNSRSRCTARQIQHKRIDERRKANDNNHKRYREYTWTVQDDSPLDKERSFGPRRGSSGRTRSRPTVINAVRETCRSNGTPTKHGVISRPLSRNNKQVSTPHIIDVRELEKWAAGKWELPECTRQHFCAPFKGQNILQRSHHTRVATKDDEARLPLQQIGVGTLSTKWIRERPNNSARRRWDEVWNIMQKPELHARRRESNLRINNADAQRMKEAGIICTASSHTTAGWVVPFTVVEKKPSGQRRRFIAWPRGKNDKDVIMLPMFLLDAFPDTWV